MRLIHAVTIAILLTPGWSFAASSEQQEMQRDIAQLQDQVRTLQSGFDQKMASLQTLVQQALDAASKANTNVSVLSAVGLPDAGARIERPPHAHRRRGGQGRQSYQ